MGLVDAERHRVGLHRLMLLFVRRLRVELDYRILDVGITEDLFIVLQVAFDFGLFTYMICTDDFTDGGLFYSVKLHNVTEDRVYQPEKPGINEPN